MDFQPLKDIPGVIGVSSEPTHHHGEKAIAIIVFLAKNEEHEQRRVVGVFTTQDKEGFGGVEFDNRKDPVALMVHKVQSVLAGTAEETE